MPDIKQVKTSLTRELEDLEFETSTLSCILLMRIGFLITRRNFLNAHYGYLMACMGKIDVLSADWSGASRLTPSDSSDDRLHEPISAPGRDGPVLSCGPTVPPHIDAHRISPVSLRPNKSTRGTLGEYILAKGSGLIGIIRLQRRTRSLRIRLYAPCVSTGSRHSVCKALNVSFSRFAEDLSHATQLYLSDFENNTNLQTNYDNAHPHIIIQEFN